MSFSLDCLFPLIAYQAALYSRGQENSFSSSASASLALEIAPAHSCSFPACPFNGGTLLSADPFVIMLGSFCKESVPMSSVVDSGSAAAPAALLLVAGSFSASLDEGKSKVEFSLRRELSESAPKGTPRSLPDP